MVWFSRKKERARLRQEVFDLKHLIGDLQRKVNLQEHLITNLQERQQHLVDEGILIKNVLQAKLGVVFTLYVSQSQIDSIDIIDKQGGCYAYTEKPKKQR